MLFLSRMWGHAWILFQLPLMFWQGRWNLACETPTHIDLLTFFFNKKLTAHGTAWHESMFLKQPREVIISTQVLAIYGQTPRYEADLVETARGSAGSFPGRKQKGD